MGAMRGMDAGLMADAEARLSALPETGRLLRHLDAHPERRGFPGMRIGFLERYAAESAAAPEDGLLTRMGDCDLVAEIAGFGVGSLNGGGLGWRKDDGGRYRIGDSRATAGEAIDVIESDGLGSADAITKRRCVDMSREDARGRAPSAEFRRLRLLLSKGVPWSSAGDAVALADGMAACADGRMMSSYTALLFYAAPGDGKTVARAMAMHPEDVPGDEWRRLASWIAAPDDGTPVRWTRLMSRAMGRVFDSPASVLAAAVFMALALGTVGAPTASDMLTARGFPLDFAIEDHNARTAAGPAAHGRLPARRAV